LLKETSLNTWAAFEEYKKGNEGAYYRYSCPEMGACNYEFIHCEY